MKHEADNTIERTIRFLRDAQTAIRDGKTNKVQADLKAAKAEVSEAIILYLGSDGSS